MALPQTQSEAAAKNLILDSLEVKNFRAFRHLQIPKLGRVNLITGKNNVGKSSLLEALWLYAERGSPNLLANLLKARNELSALSNPRTQASAGEPQILNIKYLFHGRRLLLEGDVDPIVVGPLDRPNGGISLNIEWIEEHSPIQDVKRSTQTSTGQSRRLRDVVPYVSIQVDGHASLSYRLDRVLNTNPQIDVEQESIPCKFVWPNGLGGSIIRLWDSITFTNLEDDVLDSLRLVTNDVERLSLIGEAESSRNRIPVVKLVGLDGPVPLRSLGDGMYRLFQVALALVSSKDGLLLLDEVETGLHYSVLPDVWRFVFQVSHRLNVQVFATTHSWDCIEAFQKAAAEDEQDEGVLVRLQNKDGDVTATVFDERRLAVVTREGIEVR